MVRKTKKQRLTIVHPHCAGIDVGSREHLRDSACCRCARLTGEGQSVKVRQEGEG